MAETRTELYNISNVHTRTPIAILLLCVGDEGEEDIGDGERERRRRLLLFPLPHVLKWR